MEVSLSESDRQCSHGATPLIVTIMVLFFSSAGDVASATGTFLFLNSSYSPPQPTTLQWWSTWAKTNMRVSAATPFQTSITTEPSSNLDEDLIKFAWPQDVWFHVDKLSSAHVYLRMPDGMTWDHIPGPLLADCAQLVKANSIEGMSDPPFTVILAQ